jgi:hypothetical protein
MMEEDRGGGVHWCLEIVGRVEHCRQLRAIDAPDAVLRQLRMQPRPASREFALPVTLPGRARHVKRCRHQRRQIDARVAVIERHSEPGETPLGQVPLVDIRVMRDAMVVRGGDQRQRRVIAYRRGAGVRCVDDQRVPGLGTP